MLRLPPFEHLAPRHVNEAIDMLASYADEAMLVAGGTDVFPGMKRRLFEPRKLISLGKLAQLQTFSLDDDGITLGAGLTLAQIADHPDLLRAYPALTVAAASIATPQLRNMGTLGGNLCLDTRCTYYNQSESWRESLGYCMKKDGEICWVAPRSRRCLAVQSSDTAPILIALGASVRLVSAKGERWLPVEALFRDDGIHYLGKRRDEIVTEVRLPPAQGKQMAYHKLRRRGAFDFPILSVAVALQRDADGTCSDARIVLGAVASSPLRVNAAEACLIGTRVMAEDIEAAANQVYKLAKPLDNTDMTIAYRKRMARVYAVRALRQATQTVKDG